MTKCTPQQLTCTAEPRLSVAFIAFHTEYPENIAYANTAKCGRRKDYVDTNAQCNAHFPDYFTAIAQAQKRDIFATRALGYIFARIKPYARPLVPAGEPQTPVAGTVLIMPDSTQTIDEGLLKFIVKHGYAALMVDYRGEWEDCAFHTEYPENIAYANTYA